jgi:RHS repeat-associated protein
VYHHEDASWPGFVTGITDENGDRYTRYAYDAKGRAISSQLAGGYGGITLSYTQNATTVADAAGNETVYDFTTSMARIRNFTGIRHGGQSRSFTYPTWTTDNQQRYKTVTTENGAVTTFTNDIHHKTAETVATGTSVAKTFNFFYLDDTSDRLTRVTSPSVRPGQLREAKTTYTSGLPTAIEISGYTPAGTVVSRSTTLAYNAYGQITQIDGPRTDMSDTTTLRYYECTSGNECGRLASLTNALGHVTTYDLYDNHGRVLDTTNANGVVTKYTYDRRGRTLTIAEAPPGGAAHITSFLYDDVGQLVSAEAPNGTVLTYDYDDAHNLSSITDNFGNKVAYDYDLNGNRTGESTRDPSSSLRKAIALTYDARDRVESINAAGSVTELAYDALGNLAAETDPNGNETDHGHDSLNRLVRTIDALSGITEFGYDRNDMLTSVEAPNGATTTYVYDDLGNLLSVTSPDAGMTTYTYDGAGNRTGQTDANNVSVSYSYDALNRLTGIDYAGASLDVALTYDQGTTQRGRLTTMVDGSGTTVFEYDSFGNLVEESRTIGANTHVTGYAYDEANLVTSITYPSGREVRYARNVLGQVATVESSYGGSTATIASSIAYEPFGPLKSLTFGNSLSLARVFDQQYRLLDQTTGSVQDVAFTLDNAGNIDAILDGVNASVSQSFDQDALHRITTDAGSYGTKTYTYDGVGNRLTRTHGAVTQTLTYTSNSNRLATHDGQTVTLDAAGRTLSNPAEAVSFTYGPHDRMLDVYVGAVLRASYVYNGRGQRLKKVEATGARRTFVYHYGQSGELLGETVYSSAGAKIGEKDYMWLETLPLAQAERTFAGGSTASSSLVYLHADHLNTPRIATSATGTIVWRWDSDAFGTGAANQDPDGDTNLVNVALSFPGQYLDEETGLHYNYFRDYDAFTGRYVQHDPIGLAGGLNPYAYAHGNALRYVDPFGLEVLVGQHPAFLNKSFNPVNHAAIVLRPDNPGDFAEHPLFRHSGGTLATIGGQAFGEGFGFFGNLVTAFNYPGDQPENLHDLTTVCAPEGATDTEFILKLIEAAESYGNDQSYDPFPDPFGMFFNSNSYASGVLKAAGAKVPDLPGSRPGYSRPLPLK